jgi:outer membrane autotransporter protein
LFTLFSGGLVRAATVTVNQFTDIAGIQNGDTLIFNNTIEFPDNSRSNINRTGISLTGADQVNKNVLEKIDKDFRFFQLGSYPFDTVCVGISNLIFRNTGTGAESDFGGAVYVMGKFEGNITNSEFISNASDMAGGALYFVSDFTGDITNSKFYGNRAGSSGGAADTTRIGTATDYSDMSDTTFENNKAGNRGGALYVDENAYISALNGNLTFQGNLQNYNGTTGDPNAIYMNNYAGGKTLALGAGDQQTIFFYDPIASRSTTYTNLNIFINPAKNTSENLNNIAFDGTVLFDGTNGGQSNIHGTTTVGAGTMKLQNCAIYNNNGTGNFNLNNGATLALETGSKLNVGNEITIKDGATLAVKGMNNEINATTITIANGSTLAFDLTDAKDTTTAPTDQLLKLTGTVNASPGFNASITGYEKLGAGTYRLLRLDAAIDQSMQTKLAEAVPDSLPLKIYAADFLDGFAMTVATITANEFATQNGLNGNAVGAASQIDKVGGSMINYANNLTSNEQVTNYIESIQSAPEAAAEFQGVALWNPYQRVASQRLYRNFGNANNSGMRGILGQEPCEPVCSYNSGKREFWFEGFYRYEDVDSDNTANGYNVNRGGMLLGVDKQVYNKLLLGATFGYGNPRASNRLARIEADDYTVGLYAKYNFTSSVFVNTFIGYGHQNYEFRNALNRTDYNGNSMYATVELSKQINYSRQLKLFPLLAVDFQKSWSDDFTVNVLPGLAQRIDNDSLDQTVLRIGLNSQFGNLRTRLQYGYQVGGEEYGMSRSIIGSTTQTFRGVNLGRNTFNAGIGGDIPLTRNTRLFADYDFDLGERTTAHTGQIGFVGKW